MFICWRINNDMCLKFQCRFFYKNSFDSEQHSYRQTSKPPENFNTDFLASKIIVP